MKKVKRLYPDFAPEHYDLVLRPDRERATFEGRVIISGQKTGRPTNRIALHQKNLKIKSVKVIKFDKAGPFEIKISRINTHNSFDEVRLHSVEQLYSGKYQLEIDFSGKITDPMHGIYPCNFELKGEKKQLIATQFESHHAREAFPCIDEPEAKATFQLTISSPKNETVISNTPIEKQKNLGDLLETTFEKTPKMSTYLLAFAYGELGFKETTSNSGVKVRVYATPDKVNLTGFALDVGVRCLEFLEKYYGVAYPLPKMDLVGLPDFTAGAMENWGLVTFREQVLYVDSKSTSVETKEYVAMVICHELAHQWFGNLVTMKWWNDLWLNESFANLMEYVAVDALFPKWNIWRLFVQREVSSALNRDALPNVQAVQTEVNHPDELGALFDPAIVYAKGGSLLNMAKHLVGDEAFRRGLKSYFEKYKYSNTVDDDLWEELALSSGIKIKDIMKNWLEKPGFPVLRVEHRSGSKKFSVSQERLVISTKPENIDTVWQVPIAASRTSKNEIMAKKAGNFATDKEKSYPLVLNHDGHSYFVTQYLDPEHMEEILVSVKNSTLSPIDRLLLVQNYLLLERGGRVSTLQNIQLLPAYVNEREESVWGMLAGIIGNVRNLVDKDEILEKKLNSFVLPQIRTLVKELGWKGKPSDPPQTQKLRALALSLAAVAEDQAVIKNGLSLFSKFKKPVDLAPDIRQVVYFIAVRYGTEADFNKLLKLYKTLNSADEKEEIASELTSTRDPNQIRTLIEMITGDDVRRQDSPTWFAWLMRNRYSRVFVWTWLKDNWQWIEKNYASDKSYERFARYAGMVFSYPKQLKDFQKFFEPKSNIALERTIKLAIEEIEGRIAWRQANEKPIKQWLSNLAP